MTLDLEVAEKPWLELAPQPGEGVLIALLCCLHRPPEIEHACHLSSRTTRIRAFPRDFPTPIPSRSPAPGSVAREEFHHDLRCVTNWGSYSFELLPQCARTVGPSCRTGQFHPECRYRLLAGTGFIDWTSAPLLPMARPVPRGRRLFGKRVRILELVLQHGGDGGRGVDDQLLIEEAGSVNPALRK